jgi:hypothetical protein
MIEKNSIHKNHWWGGYLFFHWVLTGVSDRIYSYMLAGSYIKKNLDPLLPSHFLKVNIRLHLITDDFKISSFHKEIIQAE